MAHVRLLRFASASLLALGIVFAGAPAQAQVAEVEPNSACLSAQNLSAATLPLTVQGSLDTPPGAPDVDFYRITGTPGERILIDQKGSASGAGTLADPFLGVFDSACALIQYADYHVNVGNWLDARIELEVPADGVLVVAASSAYDWELSGHGGFAGSYTLSVRKLPLAQAVGGRLVNAKTGAPVDGAWVNLVWCGGGVCWLTVGYATSGSDGLFRFEPGSTVWDSILRAGSYSLVVYPPEGYLTLETPIFELAEGQDLDLGNVAVSPEPIVGSIRGRVVDAVTRQPLAGDAHPFTQVNLQACPPVGTWGYCTTVAEQTTDAQGGFQFQTSYWGPLLAGRYQVTAYGDQYYATDTQIFDVADQEHFDIGEVALRSYPVRLTLASGCGPIPSTGGSCQFQVRVANGGTGKLQADVWTLVQTVGAFGPGEQTHFPAGPTKSVNLAPGASTTLSYTFNAPASLHDGISICARAYASDKKNAFLAIGNRDIFCLRKGGQGFVPLSEAEKRELLKQERAKD